MLVCLRLGCFASRCSKPSLVPAGLHRPPVAVALRSTIGATVSTKRVRQFVSKIFRAHVAHTSCIHNVVARMQHWPKALTAKRGTWPRHSFSLFIAIRTHSIYIVVASCITIYSTSWIHNLCRTLECRGLRRVQRVTPGHCILLSW